MSADASSPWVSNGASARSLLGGRELWAARELVALLALRDLRVRYKQALLGVVWIVVQPLLAVATFTVVFSHVTQVPTGGQPYPVFALAGLLSWTYVSRCVGSASEVLLVNSALITKVYFPRLVAPVAALLPPLVDLAVGLGVLAVLAACYGVRPSAALVALPLWVGLLVVTVTGPVLVLAALNVRFRDVGHLVAPVLQALLFLSPVAYAPSGLTDTQRTIYAINPVAGVVELGRWVLVGGPGPGWRLAVSAAVALAVAAAGLGYYQRAARTFADVI